MDVVEAAQEAVQDSNPDVMPDVSLAADAATPPAATEGTALEPATTASVESAVREPATTATPVQAGRRGGAGADGGAAARFREAAVPDATRTAYAGDWARWQAWAARAGATVLPADPAAVANWVAEAAQLVVTQTPPAEATTRERGDRRKQGEQGEQVKDGGVGYAPSTLARWVAGVNAVHRAAGLPAPGADPRVKATLRGIRRTARRPPRRAKPAGLEVLRPALAAIDTRHWPAAVIGRRDTALLLLGFAGALRRSELVALTLGDLEIDDGVLTVRVRSSKTDQEAAGATVGYPRGTHQTTCPACAVLAWALVLHADQNGGRAAVLRLLLDDRAGRTGRADPPTRPEPAVIPAAPEPPDNATPPASGPTSSSTPDPRSGSRSRHRCTSPGVLAVWRELVNADPDTPLLRPVTKAATVGDRPLTGSAVNDVLRRRLAAGGVDPAGYSAHSLRAGFVTDALDAGATHHQVMRQTRHTSPATVEIYARHHRPLDANAVTLIGL